MNGKIGAEGIDAGYPAEAGMVLRDLSVDVAEGEIVALVGPNGSGKSTLLRTLGRVLKPRAGIAYLDGRALRDWPTREIALRLALLPQGPTLANDLTVEELVRLGRSPHQGILGILSRADEDAVGSAIDETSIGHLIGRRVSALSGGERQRVWLAMALAQQPRVLLLIDSLNRQHDLTVVMVLHDLNQAARYANRIVVLQQGAIYADGTPVQVLTPDTLRDVFGVVGHVMPGPEGVGLVIVPVGRV
jgi:iron complex transport system ATP-binding protein